MDYRLEEFIRYSRQAKTVDQLFSLYEKNLNYYGFDHIAYVVISEHPYLSDGNPLGLVRINNLNKWEEHYQEKGYLEIDLTHKLTYSNPGIYTWEDVEKKQTLSTEQSIIFREAEEARLFNGSTFSTHGPDNTKAVTIAASSQRKKYHDQYTLDVVNIMSQQFHICLLSLHNYQQNQAIVSLSLREVETLQWAAKGLTKTEIASRLNISSHTVDFHIRNIFQKLDAKNITMAIVIAIKANLIAI